MTGEQLLTRALALFSETETEDYKGLALIHINIMLDDLWKQNNRMRLADGREELEERVQLEDLSEEIPYEDELVREAMPYGLAAKLYFDEDDNTRLSMFNEEFVNRINACDRGLVVLEGRRRNPNSEQYPIGW